MKINIKHTSMFIVLALTVSLKAAAQSAQSESEAKFGERPLDGVTVEALETYRNPKTNQATFDLSLWPFNAYYTGFGINAGYLYFLNKTLAWEVGNLSYIYTVDKGLTSELAQNYNVQPQQIERLNYVLSSNMVYYHSYGKFILLKEYIRYFRSAFLGGVGLLTTNTQSSIAASLGWKFEVYVNETFSWKVEIRDLVAIKGFTNNVAFSLGTAYSF